MALHNVNFDVKKGEFVAIIGPSGSGKTTLLNLLGALDRPTSGRVFIDGIDVSKLSNADLAKVRNRKLGFVFQDFNLLSRMSAEENVEFPLLIEGVPKEARRRTGHGPARQVRPWRQGGQERRTSSAEGRGRGWRWHAPWRTTPP